MEDLGGKLREQRGLKLVIDIAGEDAGGDEWLQCGLRLWCHLQVTLSGRSQVDYGWRGWAVSVDAMIVAWWVGVLVLL